ncbi:FAD-binding oxidoreductase [Streptomyces cirratus]|uniref:FAD-binding oxidoreductase n=1 Tax=Streptomyces cirratus TaxID=68187 RepID=UPI00361FA985
MSSTPRTATGTAAAPSRRRVLGGIAATAVAVVGWNTVDQSWATAAEASGAAVVPVPALTGTLETSPSVVEAFGKDFGHLWDGAGSKPWAVLRPGNADDIVKIVNYARANGIKVAVNGQGGSGTDIESHSVYGQARVPGGISIDARSMSKIVSIGGNCAVVEAGVTWAQLTDACLQVGKTPPALPDYLYLSVGGTISIGGIGGTVAKYGLLCDTVRSIDIVTGEGSWSPRRRRTARSCSTRRCRAAVRSASSSAPKSPWSRRRSGRSSSPCTTRTWRPTSRTPRRCWPTAASTSRPARCSARRTARGGVTRWRPGPTTARRRRTGRSC